MGKGYTRPTCWHVETHFRLHTTRALQLKVIPQEVHFNLCFNLTLLTEVVSVQTSFLFFSSHQYVFALRLASVRWDVRASTLTK